METFLLYLEPPDKLPVRGPGCQKNMRLVVMNRLEFLLCVLSY